MDFVTFPELLRYRRDQHPDRPLYTFLRNGEQEEGTLTYGEFERRSRALAGQLATRTERGCRVLLLFPPGLELIVAFFACLRCGVIAVPAFPPSRRALARLHAIAKDARPTLALTTRSLLPRIEAWTAQTPGLKSLPVLATESLPSTSTGWSEPDLPGEAIAFLQYTSGSTGAPKGVMVSHGNLVHNQALLRDAFPQSGRMVVVGWLPPQHDMGLIGNILHPLYRGGRAILMPPVAFLQRPARWLQAISKYRATISGGPNFAYDLCVSKIEAGQRAELRLDTWEVAFNGAEPVRHETLERFSEAFASCGFRSRKLYPCYGLAESTLIVTGRRSERLPVVQRVSAPALEEHRWQPAEDGEASSGTVASGTVSRSLVSSGRATSAVQLEIVDAASRAVCGPAEIGEVWVRGDSVALGYWNNESATTETFGGYLVDGEGPFLRTGDLGFRDAEGELFITGRLKDLIIIRGRNHYPQDIERTVEESHPGLRGGCGAAFSIDAEGEEQLVVVQEVERRAEVDPQAAGYSARTALAAVHELRLRELVLIRFGSLPKTSSGKIRRRACRRLYLEGGLLEVGRSVLVSQDLELEQRSPSREELLALPETDRSAALGACLRQLVGHCLRLAPGSVDAEKPLSAQGMDSLGGIELASALEEDFGVRPTMETLLDRASLDSLREELLAGLEEGVLASSIVLGPSRVESGSAPLSWGQEALWFLNQLAPESGAYNLAAALRLSAPVDPERLRRCLRHLVQRHGALRTTFEERDDVPVQRVHATLEPDFEWQSVAGWEPPRIAQRLSATAWRPFDLGRGPLLRVLVCRGAPEGDLLLLAAHHIVTDFWSLALIGQQLGALYGAEEGLVADPLRLDYSAFVGWQRCQVEGPAGERLWRYWQRALGDLPAELDLPTDRPRPSVQSYHGGLRCRPLGQGLAGPCHALARAHGATPFMVLLAAFETLLWRSTGQTDFVVGTPAAGRPSREFSEVVGYFINPLALRADLSGDPSFDVALQRVRRVAAEAFEHSAFPFSRLAERLQPERDASRSPIFQTLVSFVRSPAAAPEELAALALGEGGHRCSLGALEVESFPLPTRFAELDLTLVAAEVDGEMRTALRFNTDLFDPSTAERLLRRLELLFTAAVASPDRRLSELPVLARGERQQVLREWNDTGVNDRSPLLPERLESRTSVHPERVAAVHGEHHLTYGELSARSNALAEQLSDRGLGRDSLIAVSLERSLEMLTAVLATFRLGSAYLPLDPVLPAERRSWMIADAAPDLLIVSGLSPALGAVGVSPQVFNLQVAASARSPARSGAAAGAPSQDEPTAGQPAYVIYTSGSTGRPKGVQVSHGALANFLASMAREPGLDEGDSILSVTTLSFDIAALELFLPLWVGARTHMLSATEAADGKQLAAALLSSRASHLQATPATWRMLLESGWDGDPELVALCGGEALDSALGAEITKICRQLWNLYGPTEATVWSALQSITGSDQISIGRPIANTQIALLDRRFQAVPIGVVGELYIGGQGLADGYLRRPALTAERFLPDGLSALPGRRLYRTGDLARCRPNGQIDCLGRVDHQVKVRGFRIELGEIEVVLARHPGVRQAVVVAWSGDDRDVQLVAHVLAEEGEPPRISALRSWLTRRLPAYMLPAAYVFHESLPLTPSGKVDRSRLLAASSAAGDEGSRVSPRTPTEDVLAGLWAAVLKRPRVGVFDHFFELGGHSLQATRLMARIRETFEVDIPLHQLFQRPVLADFAEVIEARRGITTIPLPPLAPADPQGAFPLSPAQERLWLYDRVQPGSWAYNMPAIVRLSGTLDLAALEASIREILRRHAVLRSAYVERADGVVQEERAVDLPLPVVDLAYLTAADRRRLESSLAGDEARAHFRLERAPQLRALLLRTAENQHALVITAHHISADAGSMEIFFDELAKLYESYVTFTPAPLEELPIAYGDYATWQVERLSDEVLKDSFDYWRQQLADLPATTMPFDRPRSATPSFRGASCRRVVEGRVVARLRALAAESTTPFVALLAAFQALIGRWCGMPDVAVGTPVANRSHQESEPLIGLFVNMLVLRSDLADHPTYRCLLDRVRRDVLAGHHHRWVPFETLVERLASERTGGFPAIEVTFALRDPAPRLRLPGLAVEVEEIDTGSAKFDLSLFATLDGERLELLAEVRPDLFDRTTTRRLLEHFETLLTIVLEDPEQCPWDVSLLSSAQRHQALWEWNDTASDDALTPVHLQIQEQCRLRPGALAVDDGALRLTYGGAGLTGRLAGFEIARSGCGARRDRQHPVAAFRRPGHCGSGDSPGWRRLSANGSGLSGGTRGVHAQRLSVPGADHPRGSVAGRSELRWRGSPAGREGRSARRCARARRGGLPAS